MLTHWGRVTHICVGKQTSISSDNGLSPGRRQAIIWTNAGILLIGPLGTNFSEIPIKILTFSFTKMRLEVSSAKWRRFCLGLNALTEISSAWQVTGTLFRDYWPCYHEISRRYQTTHGDGVDISQVYFVNSHFENSYFLYLLWQWFYMSATEPHWW